MPEQFMFTECAACGQHTALETDGRCADRSACDARIASVFEGQPMPQPGQHDVTSALITELLARQQKGIVTYGTSLQTFNGRNALRDALDEALDFAQYLKQALMEHEELYAQIRTLSNEVILCCDAKCCAGCFLCNRAHHVLKLTGGAYDRTR